MRPVLVCSLGLATACGASFDDLSPDGSGGGGRVSDAETLRVLASGQVDGVGTYSGTGSVVLEESVEGDHRLVFGADLRVSSVPGPVVVMSDRTRIGASLSAGDFELGAMDSVVGAQAFAVPADAVGLSRVWIWCKPFGVDIAAAQLEYTP